MIASLFSGFLGTIIGLFALPLQSWADYKLNQEKREKQVRLENIDKCFIQVQKRCHRKKVFI